MSFYPGMAMTFTITGVVGIVPVSTTVSNAAVASAGNECGFTPGAVTNTTSFLLEASLALSIAATMTQTPAAPITGERIVYTIVLENTGQANITNIVVVDTISPVVTGATTDQPAAFPAPSVTQVIGGTMYVWSAAGLDFIPGESLTLTVTGRVGVVCTQTGVVNAASLRVGDGSRWVDSTTNQVEFALDPSVVGVPQLDWYVYTDISWIHDIDFFGPRSGVATGFTELQDHLPVLQFDGVTWHRSGMRVGGCRYSGQDVSLTSSRTGWMTAYASNCGDELIAGQWYELSGTAWIGPQPYPIGVRPYSRWCLTMVSPDDGWHTVFVDPDYDNLGEWEVYRFGRKGWTRFQTLEPGGSLWQYSFVWGMPETGWAIDGHGMPWRLGRRAWVQDPAYSLPFGLYDTFMNSPTDVWGISFGERIAHYDGMTWSQVPGAPNSPKSMNMVDVGFFDAEHGMIVGGAWNGDGLPIPVVLCFVNGSWHYVPVSTPSELGTWVSFELVEMIGPREAWVSGYSFNWDTKIHYSFLVRILIPEPCANGSVTPARVASTGEVRAGTLKVGRPKVTLSHGSETKVSFRADISERCSGSLTVWSARMVPVHEAFFIGSETAACDWHVKPDDLKLPLNEYVVVVEAERGGERAMAMRRFFVPGAERPLSIVQSSK